MAPPRSRIKLVLLIALPIFLLCLAGVGGVGVWFFLWFLPRLNAAAEVRPTVRITARSDGAWPQEVEKTITIPLEVQLSGMEGLETIESVSSDDGVTLTLYLRPGTDLNVAQVLAQNRVALAHPILPDIVKRNGVTVTTSAPLPALWLLLTSPGGRHSDQHLQNFAEAELVPLLRAPGVEGIHVGRRVGRRRFRFDLERLAAFGLVLEDVAHAAGLLDRKLPDKELEEIVVGKTPGGGDILVRDVALPVAEEGPERLEYARWQGTRAVAVTVEGRDAGAALSSVQQRLPQLQQALKEDMELHLLPGPLAPGSESIVIEGRLPDGASLERVRNAVDEIAVELDRLPDARAKSPTLAVLTLPSEDASGFRLVVTLCPAGERASTHAEVREQVRQILGRREGMMGRVVRPEALARPPHLRAPVVLALAGPDLEKSVRLADTIRERLTAAGFREVWPDYPRLVPRLHFDVDREKARQLGISVQEILDQLQIVGARQMCVEGRVEALGELKVRGTRGEAVPLKAVVNVREPTGPAYLRRVNGERRLLVTANPPSGVKPDEARRRCREIAEQNLPAGYKVDCTGSDYVARD